MEQNLNRGIAILKGFSRALYCDLGEMTGLCVEGHVHLAQNTSDLDEIAMRMLGEAGELIKIVGESWCRRRLLARLCFWCRFASRAALNAPRAAVAIALGEYSSGIMDLI